MTYCVISGDLWWYHIYHNHWRFPCSSSCRSSYTTDSSTLRSTRTARSWRTHYWRSALSVPANATPCCSSSGTCSPSSRASTCACNRGPAPSTTIATTATRCCHLSKTSTSTSGHWASLLGSTSRVSEADFVGHELFNQICHRIPPNGVFDVVGETTPASRDRDARGRVHVSSTRRQDDVSSTAANVCAVAPEVFIEDAQYRPMSMQCPARRRTWTLPW